MTVITKENSDPLVYELEGSLVNLADVLYQYFLHMQPEGCREYFFDHVSDLLKTTRDLIVDGLKRLLATSKIYHYAVHIDKFFFIVEMQKSSQPNEVKTLSNRHWLAQYTGLEVVK